MNFSCAVIITFLILLIMAFLCCEETNHIKRRKLLVYTGLSIGHNKHAKKSKNGHLNAQQVLKAETFTSYEFGNGDVAANTLPRPHRTKKKGNRKKHHRKNTRHPTPPMVVSNQGNLVTGIIAPQHYYYQHSDTGE